MRCFFTSMSILLAGPVLGPAFLLPEVIDTKKSIRTRIGHVSNNYYTCQSNIMAGIFEVESGTLHRYKYGPKKGKLVTSKKGAIGAGQLMPFQTSRNAAAEGFNLNALGDNIEASNMVFREDMAYYLKKGFDARGSLLRSIQAYNAGRKGRLDNREAARKYMWKVLKVAEGKRIPNKYQ